MHNLALFRRLAATIALILSLCFLAADARAALLPEDAPVKWKAFWGLGDPVGEAFKARGLQAYREGEMGVAAQLLYVARDFLPLDPEVIGRLGFALKEIGRYEDAQELLFQATIEDAENHFPWLWLGDAQRLLGEYEAAYQSMLTARDLAPTDQQEEYQQYVDYTEQLGTEVPSWTMFERHRDFANRHQNSRRYHRMIAELEKALDLAPPTGFEENDAELKVAWVLNTIGDQYSHIKETDVSIDYYRRSIQAYDRADSMADVMRVTQNLAVAYSWLADRDPDRKDDHLDRAIENWQEVIRLARELNNVEYLRYAHGLYLADLVDRYGTENDEVKHVREVVMKELPRSGPLPDYSTAAVGFGEARARLAEEDWAGARVVLEMTIPYYGESKFLIDLERAARLQGDLAQAYYHQDHYARALEIAADGRQVLRDLRQFLDADAFNRSTNPKTLRHLATVSMRAAVAKGDANLALQVFESYRQRARLDMLGSKVRDEAWRTDYPTEAKLIADRIPAIEVDLAKAEADRDAYQSDRLQRRLEEDRERLSWLEHATTFTDANRVSVARLPELTPEEAVAAQSSQSSLLALAFDDVGGVSIVVTSEGIEGTLLDLNDDALRGHAAELAAALRNGDAAAVDTQAGALYEALIAPNADQLQGNTLYISGDPLLAGIPAELFLSGGERLGDTHVIAYTASASYLDYSTRLAGFDTRGLRAVLAGSTDAQVLTPALEGLSEKDVLTGEEATETAVYETKPRRPYLHVSGGTDFTQRDPMLSAVLVREDDTQDGDLHATELLTALLPYNVVVLDTAQKAGDLVRGDVLGAFSEGLLHAGAPAMVVNRWAVSDAVRAAFYGAFYGALMDQDAAAALQAGRKAARDAGADSFDWAAFSLFGPAD
jgi:CHAT domain-containing protein/sugar phosphate isomerase/epimerase